MFKAYKYKNNERKLRKVTVSFEMTYYKPLFVKLDSTVNEITHNSIKTIYTKNYSTYSLLLIISLKHG